MSATPATAHRPSLAAPIVAALALLLGCDRVDEDRDKVAARQKAQVAISAYSEASKAANGLHGEVIAAFQRANASASLADYREAMRREVQPAMDRFIERLQAMPVGTPELVRIHGGLITAYRDARNELSAYGDELQTAQDLARFAPIRERLQQRVAAYRSDLEAYYGSQERQLKVEPAAVGGPEAATATAP